MKEIKCPHCGEKFTIDEASYADILSQVRNQQFEEEVSKQLERERNLAIAQVKESYSVDIGKIKEELALAKADQVKMEAEKDRILGEIKIAKESEISNLKAKIENNETEKQLAVKEAESRILETANELKIKLATAEKDQLSIRENYERKLADINDELERLRDNKMKLSTKMVGESLEQYCLNEFNAIRASAFPNAYFAKDNDAKAGSKGDFIFRDPSAGVEAISIMFEMKNENEETIKKQKNEKFFAKLDKDRNEKKCEYAVLVTTLEEDSELYNRGIVDVTYAYPKMYVIRPQFFIPLITFLKSNAEKSLAARKELALVKSQNIDITNFEDDVNKWKDSFSVTIKNVVNKYNEALKQIDKAIEDLKKVRDSLTTSGNHLITAEKKMGELTVKHLTRNNPTMQEKFAELENKKTKE